MFDLIFKIGLTAILIFTPLARGTTTTRIWAITPVLLMIYTLVFLWLWRVNNSKQSTIHGPQKTPLDKPILAFVILAVISFVLSIYKHDSFYALLRLFAYVGLFYLIVNNYSRELRRYLVGLVICIGTGLSIYGLLQYFGILPHPWWVPMEFLAATYVSHNHFAGYLELVIPITIGVLLRYKSVGSTLRLTIIEALLAMLAAFIFTQSRGAWISLTVSLVVMDLILIRNKIFKKNTLVILIILITFIVSFAYIKSEFISQRIQTFAKIGKGEISSETRLQIWKGTVDMIHDSSLIGTGIGTFVWGFPRYRPMGLDVKANYAHNDYLHMAAEMGILAPAIMVWMLAIVLGKGLGYRGHMMNPVILGCAIGMLSLALHNFIDFNFHIPANMILFIMCGGIIIGESLSNR